MALTATEEALLRDLLAKQAQLIALANNETTITAKLGSTKATIDDLTAATTVADADLMIVRQNGVDKKLPVSVVKSDLVDLSSYAPKASPALTGTPTAPTAPAGTNTTQLATTAFVRRAQGNFGAWTSIVASGGAIPAAEVGNAVQVHLPSDGFIYLPLSAQCVSGAALHITNTSYSAKVTLTVQAPDSLTLPITLHPSESVTVVASSNTWFVFAGGGALDKTPRFGASLAAAGYQRLPSGLIAQWGVTNSASAGQAVSATFAIAFPTACIQATMSAGTAGANVYVSGVTFTATTISGRVDGSGTSIARYIAIGH